MKTKTIENKRTLWRFDSKRYPGKYFIIEQESDITGVGEEAFMHGRVVESDHPHHKVGNTDTYTVCRYTRLN